MLTSADVKGVIAAIVTPFDENGQVSSPAIETITEYLVTNGVHAIMAAGETGEFPHLLQDERKYVTRLIAEQVNGRIPVIAGTAACSNQETLLLMDDTRKQGKRCHSRPHTITLPRTLYDFTWTSPTVERCR